MMLRTLVEDLKAMIYFYSTAVSIDDSLVEAVVTPLIGHTSQETAYVVDDYPYGRKVRTKIRYWLETDQRKGSRFVSQTLKPGTAHWNAPKKSTYALIGAMYLDEQGYVQWKGISPYSKAEEVLAFVREFPGVEKAKISAMAKANVKALNGYLDGSLVFTINGQPRPWTETDNARHQAELEAWSEVNKLVN